MKHSLRHLYLPCFILLPALLSGGQALAERIYKWVDEDGKTQYGDRVPARYSTVERSVMNDQGRTVKVYEAAKTPEEKAAASGFPSTAQEFIRRAKEGYYSATKGFSDSKARREWKHRFKQDMRAHTDRWRYNWHSYWAQRAPYHPGMGFALPFLSLLHGAVTVLFIIAMVSLLAKGSAFGLAVPAGVPVWAAALLLFIAYGILIGPLKIARRSIYYGPDQSGWAWSSTCFLDSVIWIAVVLALLWLAAYYLPDLRDAIHNLPSVAHRAADDIQSWWNGK